MKLAQLFAPFRQFKLGNAADKEIVELTFDSKGAKPGVIFVAVRGSNQDGHKFLPEVCRAGVSGVVVEDATLVPQGFEGAVLTVENSRNALFQLAHNFYGRPTEDLFFVGVTGTNGKTSVTYLVEAILAKFGLPAGVMGTINHHFQNHVWDSVLTTPDAISLNQRLRDFQTLGAKAVAMEVSSHAIDQGRAAGIPFDAIVFTNLTRDHLDYHSTMENYFAAKEKLFTQALIGPSVRKRTAIINANDSWGVKLQTAPDMHKWTYGENRSDFQFQILSMDFSRTRFRLKTPRGNAEINSPLIGRYNVYNTVAAMACGMALGASLNTVTEAIESFTGVPGRLQRLSKQDLNVFVDYAHTDNALLSILSTFHHVREVSHKKGRIFTVFGCGGDRDQGKRQLMAKVAVELSDIVMVTSDNPRTEPPMNIISEITKGVPNTLMNRKVFVEVDRREAIRRVIEMANSGDIVLVAGKGHEDYQIIGDKKFAFNDLEIVKSYLNGL